MAQSEFTDFEVQVDLSNVDAWGGESRPPLPPGDYIFTATHVEQKNAKTSGNPMIVVTFTVDDESSEYNGFKVFNNYVLTQNAMGRLKQLMIAVGGSLDGKIRASEILGAKIRASVINETVVGQPDANGNPGKESVFARIQNELPLEDAPVQQATPAKAATPPVARGNQQATGAKNGAARRA